MAKYRVAIIQRRLTHYRKPFFFQLREKLEDRGIDLVLIYGKPTDEELRKKDHVDLDWAVQIENKKVSIGSKSLLWQPALKHLKGVDIVIVEQASRLLLNYILLLLQILGKYKVAFWGHGRSFQPHLSSKSGEYIKKLISRQAWWWFAYNDLSASAVSALGYPPERVTSVMTAIDTRPLMQAFENITDEQMAEIRKEEGINGHNVCIYTSSLYQEKRIDFLLEACQYIRKEISDFEIIIIGAGPQESLVKEAATAHAWIHYKGSLFDAEKVPYFKLSRLMLLPGLVGLSVVDSFALETPLVTTSIDYHSPEIDYLESGVNGLIVSPADNVRCFAHAVIDLLKDNSRRQKMVAACREARELYTLDRMSDRFADGILHALTDKSDS
jgi:glycosyltransferase involved in cell wall biosynthesis